MKDVKFFNTVSNLVFRIQKKGKYFVWMDWAGHVSLIDVSIAPVSTYNSADSSNNDRTAIFSLYVGYEYDGMNATKEQKEKAIDKLRELL